MPRDLSIYFTLSSMKQRRNLCLLRKLFDTGTSCTLNTCNCVLQCYRFEKTSARFFCLDQLPNERSWQSWATWVQITRYSWDTLDFLFTCRSFTQFMCTGAVLHEDDKITLAILIAFYPDRNSSARNTELNLCWEKYIWESPPFWYCYLWNYRLK